MLERKVSNIKEAIRIYARQTGEPWPELIPQLTQALNNRRLSSGLQPSHLMFGGTTPNDPTNLIQESQITTSVEDFIKLFDQGTRKARERHIERRTAIDNSSRKYANKTKKPRTFHQDQIVYLKNFLIAPDKGSALLVRHSGPYQIQQIYKNNHSVLLVDITTDKKRVAHIAHLKPATSGTSTFPLPEENEALKLIKISEPTNQIQSEDQHATNNYNPHNLCRSPRLNQK